MATFATESVTSSGLDATANAVDDVAGDKVSPGTILRVVNGSGASIDLTMVTPQTVDGDLAVDDRVVSIPAGEFRYVRASSLYRNPADGLVDLQWSAGTSVTCEVIV